MTGREPRRPRLSHVMRRTTLLLLLALVPGCTKMEKSAPEQTMATAPALPPPSNEAQLQQQMLQEFRDLNPAQQAWNPPAGAKLYQRTLVTYRIAPKGTPGNVGENLPGGGSPQVFQSNVSQRVKAQLAGPAFDIDPREPLAQTLAPGQAAEWTWWVTPNETGAQTLQLKSWLILNAGGADQEVALPSRFHDVDVEFNLAGWATLHWQLLLSAILLPLGGWVCKEGWQRLRRRPGPP